MREVSAAVAILIAASLFQGCGGGGGGGTPAAPSSSLSLPTPPPLPSPGPAPTGTGGAIGGPSITATAMPAGFQEPRGLVAVGPSTIVTGRDSATGKAVILMLSAGPPSVIATGDQVGTPNAMTDPIALARDASGTLYVADATGSFNDAAAGAVLTASGGSPRVISAGAIDIPSGLALSADQGTLFVTGYDPADGKGAVFRLDLTTQVVSVVAKGGLLTKPCGIAVASSGHLVVSDGGAGSSKARLLDVDPSSGSVVLVHDVSNTVDAGSGVLGDDLVASNVGAGGRLARVSAGGETTVISAPLISPGGVASSSAGTFVADTDAGGTGQIVSIK